MVMLARRRNIRLSNGVEVQTPLLVPSFSSMAMGPIPYAAIGTKPVDTICSIVHTDALVGSIEEALLLSAYDIHYGFLSAYESLSKDFQHSPYSQARFLILDSGWYEKDGASPGKLFIENIQETLTWEEAQYAATLDTLDANLRANAVSWDYDGPYAEQIAKAQDFFGGRTRFASTLLLKSPKEARFHHFGQLSGEDVANLRAFDIVGVTEKELGETILDKLVAIARLRMLMDDAGVPAPIHVFGGLDPLSTPLYVAAGGEIFDGLGWLRYAYMGGSAFNRDAAMLLEQNSDKRWSLATTSIQLDNLNALAELRAELQVFIHAKEDWKKFRRGDDLRPVFELFSAKLEAGHGR